MGSLVLLDLIGGVALLLWGLHMVLTGVLRAFGPDLRRFLSKALSNRFKAFGAGLALTALMQSSTATGLMTASLAADGTVGLVPALAIMLGANVGTTLIVQILSFDISAIAPALFIVGVITFRAGGQSIARALGPRRHRSRTDSAGAAHPARHARAGRAGAGGAGRVRRDHQRSGAVRHLAAALTWAAHSSVAVVLLVMSLAYSHFIAAPAALALVLGANLGSAINPLIEGGVRAAIRQAGACRSAIWSTVRRVALVLPFLHPFARELPALQPDAAKMTAEFHLLFNVVLAVIFIGPLDALAGLLVRLLPEQKRPDDPSVPRYLDDAALETPPLALANAARETLRMGDTLETMLRDVMTALMTNDRKLASEVSRRDNVVDRLTEAVKFYVTKLTRDSLDEREGQRAMEIVSFTINLEHIGDIIDKNLCELASKKIKRRYQFSAEGAAELTAFHKRVCESLQAAFGIFMTGDVEAARRLRAKNPIFARPNWRRPTGISSGCGKAVRKVWKRPRSTSTS